jgi:hypothetical protein
MPEHDMERRTTRSDARQEALTLLLEEAVKRLSITAVALTTSDGLLIAGAGAGNLDELGAIGVSNRKDWDGTPVHSRTINARGEELVLTSAGRAIADAELEAGIGRILG